MVASVSFGKRTYLGNTSIPNHTRSLQPSGMLDTLPEHCFWTDLSPFFGMRLQQPPLYVRHAVFDAVQSHPIALIVSNPSFCILTRALLFVQLSIYRSHLPPPSSHCLSHLSYCPRCRWRNMRVSFGIGHTTTDVLSTIALVAGAVEGPRHSRSVGAVAARAPY